MLIKKNEINTLSENIRRVIDGQIVDFRDNKEGPLSILKNDIHTFANFKNEQMNCAVAEHKLLTEYIANISHQIKTPLTSVQIMVELLETAPPEQQAEFIYNIQTSLAHMDWLTTTLLKMARLDSGMITFSESLITVSELCKTALESLEIVLDIKDQTVTILHDIDIVCDNRWMAEALTNLIKNASEHSPDNSTILVDCGENPIYRWISITDAGNGISKVELSNIWTRFTGSSGKNSNGIGLPLALAIVRSQNGDIDVNGGGKGVGASFIIKLLK